MPLYDFTCEKCNKTVECYVKHSRYAPDVIMCCGKPMKRCFPAPALKKEFFPYFDKGLGRYVNSNSERKEIMKATGTVQE